MKAIIAVDQFDQTFSPYIAKAALGRLYKAENFKFVVDRMEYIAMEAKEDGSVMNARYLVVFHVKSTGKVGNPIVIRDIEAKVRRLILKGPHTVNIFGKEKDFPMLITRVQDTDVPMELNMPVKDMLLNVEMTGKRQLILKIFDGKIEHGILDLRHVKPRIKKPWEYRMGRADELE